MERSSGFRIVIEGVGEHHQGLESDADQLARVLVSRLLETGHRLGLAVIQTERATPAADCVLADPARLDPSVTVSARKKAAEALAAKQQADAEAKAKADAEAKAKADADAQGTVDGQPVPVDTVATSDVEKGSTTTVESEQNTASASVPA